MKDDLQIRTLYCSKSISLLLILSLAIIELGCESQRKSRPSPLRSDSATVHNVPVYIEFSSPAVRERKIFGEDSNSLVRYGEIWRTGANEATFVSIAADLSFDTLALDSGTYSLFTIPGEEDWTIVFNKEWDQWGSYSRKDSLDVGALSVRARTVTTNQEQMLFYFAEDSLKFRWGQVRWAIPIFSRP